MRTTGSGLRMDSSGPTNPQAGGDPNGLQSTPRKVPENGGAPNATAPNRAR
jgi:hypothetical protein